MEKVCQFQFQILAKARRFATEDVDDLRFGFVGKA